MLITTRGLIHRYFHFLMQRKIIEGKAPFIWFILKRGHILWLFWKLFGHNKVSHNSFTRSFNRKSFKLAFELLQGVARTGCQSIIVFATDGVDNDGDPVRCGPGYYTRSGYVPGQICKYDWNDVWDEVLAKNRYMIPRVRKFVGRVWYQVLNLWNEVVLFLLNSLVGIKMVVSLHFFKACHAIFLDAVCFNRLCLLM